MPGRWPSGLRGVFQADQEVKSLLRLWGWGRGGTASPQGGKGDPHHGLTFTGAPLAAPPDPAPSVLLLGAVYWAVRESATPRLGGRDKGHLSG